MTEEQKKEMISREFFRILAHAHGFKDAVAVEAHRNKWSVKIRGRGVRLKTQIRVDKGIEFPLSANAGRSPRSSISCQQRINILGVE